MTDKNIAVKAGILSILILGAFLVAWHFLVLAQQGPAAEGLDPAYAELLGKQATQGDSAIPKPLEVAAALWEHIRDPFYDAGPNDKGIGIQLAYSLFRVLAGFGLAALVAIPLGFVIGMSRWSTRRSIRSFRS